MFDVIKIRESYFGVIMFDVEGREESEFRYNFSL